MAKNNSRLIKLPEHTQLKALLSGDNNSTEGINEAEIKHLAWLATQIPNGGDIVEIGSHKGKSICCMAAACRSVANDTARIFAVDMWTLGKGKTFAHYSSEETFDTFKRQVAEMGLTERIRPVQMESIAASKKRSKPIHLLFIDASHKYKDVLADYQAWSKFVPVGGWIAFHDYTTRFPGVKQLIDETVIPSGLWEEASVHGRIWSARRVK